MRRAIVKNADNQRQVEAYLPDNYRVVRQCAMQTAKDPIMFIIEGEDRMGWTLDDYVIPRLASGLIFAMEVDA